MALKQQKTTKNDTLQTQGPVNEDGGYGATALPSNPSDQIFQGRAIPIIPAQDVVQRRSFSIPIRPTLHYRDGLDGAAEVITVNERRFHGNPEDGTGESEMPPYGPDQCHDEDHAEFGANPGVDKNKYSQNPNVGMTTNGVEIRGT